MDDEKSERVCVWPCGTWCYESGLEEMLQHKSDDFEVVPADGWGSAEEPAQKPRNARRSSSDAR